MKGMARTLYRGPRQHIGRFYCRIHPVHYRTGIASSRIPLSQLGPEITASGKVQIDYKQRYAHMRTCAAHSKFAVDPGATRSL